MCLKPRSLPPIPDDTRSVAEQIYPPEHPLRRLGEDYADVLCDQDFADLYSSTGKPALSPALLALVTVLQATEHCSDRVAAEMVRSRIDWKYALHLPLAHPGFDASVLCEFRQRLVTHQAERRVFDAFLRRLKERGFLKGRAVQRTDSLAIIAAVRELSLLELVMETLRLALEAVPRHDPAWLKAHVPEDWLHHYGPWTQAERLIRETGSRASAEAQRLLSRAGQDGFALLEALEAEDAALLRSLAAVDVLRTVWTQQYQRSEPRQGPLPAASGAESNKTVEADVKAEADVKIRSSVQTRPAPALDDGQRGRVIITPHDPQARWATKQGHAWAGYKLHLTETATEDAPLLITDLDIVAAAAHDSQAVDPIQARLRACGLLPDTHLADAGYVNGLTIQSSLGCGVSLLGPISADILGPARKDTILPPEAFAIDVENQQATCPGGHSARLWSLYQRSSRKGRSLIAIAWDKQTCSQCPLRSQCLPPGQVQRVLRLSPYYTLLTNRRAEQKTVAFRERYRRRAGIEATFSHLVNVHRARRTPYCGAAKTLCRYAALAVGVNLRRVALWEAGQRPQRQRLSPLARLLADQNDENQNAEKKMDGDC